MTDRLRFMWMVAALAMALWVNDRNSLFFIPLALMMPVLSSGGKFFWIGQDTQLKETTVPSQTSWAGASTVNVLATGGGILQFGQPARVICFDRANNLIYAATGSTIFKFTPAGASPAGTKIVDISNIPTGIDVDPTNSRLFYTTEAGELRKVNTDGSGDTQLVNWSSPRTGQGAVACDLTDNVVYYVKKTTSGSGTAEIRKIAPDGSGDALIATVSVTTVPECPSISIDVVNRKLFWIEHDDQVGTNAVAVVKSSAMDGSGSSTLYTLTGSNVPEFPCVCFSQSQAKLHVWTQNNGLGGDQVVYRMNNDGSGSTSLGIIGVTRALCLCDGLETVGPGAIL